MMQDFTASIFLRTVNFTLIFDGHYLENNLSCTGRRNTTWSGPLKQS